MKNIYRNAFYFSFNHYNQKYCEAASHICQTQDLASSKYRLGDYIS